MVRLNGSLLGGFTSVPEINTKHCIAFRSINRKNAQVRRMPVWLWHFVGLLDRMILSKPISVIHVRNDPKFSDRLIWANSADPLIRTFIVCYSICVFLTKYAAVWLLCLNFRVITARFSGVRKLRNFTVSLYRLCVGRSVFQTERKSESILQRMFL